MKSSNGLKSVVSVSQDAVRRYIMEQQGKDVFEYSIFQTPQLKIGDFTR